jgi:hypothetical protein
MLVENNMVKRLLTTLCQCVNALQGTGYGNADAAH